MRNVKAHIGFAVLAIVFLAGGCMTMLKGDEKKVRFTSEPSGATVVVVSMKNYFRYRSQSPVKVPLKTDHAHVVMYELPGYHVQTLPIVGTTSAGMVAGSALANFIWWGPLMIPAMMIDVGSGSTDVLPDGVHLTLTPEDQPAPPNNFRYEVVLAKVEQLVDQKGNPRKVPGRKGSGMSNNWRQRDETNGNDVETLHLFEKYTVEKTPIEVRKPRPPDKEAICKRERDLARLSGGRKKVSESCR